MRLCSKCGVEIPQARIQAMHHATTCVDCSEECPVKGHVEWQGKHTPVLMLTENLPTSTRRGFHANIPVNSYSNPRLVQSTSNRNLSQQISDRPDEYEYSRINQQMARCHPERPTVNVKSGLCAECAIDWYRRRLR